MRDIGTNSRNHELTAEIGRKVRAVRTELGMSAKELSEKTLELGHGIPRSTISQLETGLRTSITIMDVLILGEALEIAPALLLIESWTKPSALNPSKKDGLEALTSFVFGWNPGTRARPLQINGAMYELGRIGGYYTFVSEKAKESGDITALNTAELHLRTVEFVKLTLQRDMYELLEDDSRGNVAK